MVKGFGNTKSNEVIHVKSMVSARNGEPLVEVEWGRNSGILTPNEARAHAFSILEAAAAAEMDAVVVKWAQQELGMDLTQAAYLRRLFQDKREAGEMPSCTMNFDGERMTPEEVRRCATDMLFMAFHTEMEAFLAHFLITEVGSDEAQVNVVIEVLREMRGLKRIDEIGNP